MVSTFHWFFTLNYTDIMMKYKIMKYKIMKYNITFLPSHDSFYKMFYFICLIVLMFNHNNILYILEYFHWYISFPLFVPTMKEANSLLDIRSFLRKHLKTKKRIKERMRVSRTHVTRRITGTISVSSAASEN